MTRFSQRVGERAPFNSGLEDASQNLRVATWNKLHELLLPTSQDQWRAYQRRASRIWDFLGWATDEVSIHAFDARRTLKAYWFDKSDWHEFFDLFEFGVILIASEMGAHRAGFFEIFNVVLEEQGCAYRFIAEELAPITNPIEMSEVSTAAESSIASVAQHIRAALSLLPPNAELSPRNSVKESISAVEAALKHLTNNPSADLTSALSAFERRYGPMHPALRGGLVKLYGYTSDEKGIRHALVDEAVAITVDDARFMLVTCSAFANYLVALASRKSA